MEGLSIILADSALEPVPKELSNHPVIRKYRTLYKKHSDNILLDKSFHSPCMKLLPDNEKRGRPDIVHFSLISLTSSPLYLEKKLKVYVHTVTNSVIDINFGVRLPKSYSRFSSLMEQLFSIKTIIKDLYLLKDLQISDSRGYFNRYFSMAIPEPKIISAARNSFGSINLGYLIINPIRIEKIPISCRDFAM